MASLLPLLIPLLLLLGLVPLVLVLIRANELVCLRAREGRVTVVRGRIPPKLLEDIRDILGRPPVDSALVRLVSEDSRPRVYVEGELSEAQRQQLRNVVAMWPLPRLRSAPRGGRAPRD